MCKSGTLPKEAKLALLWVGALPETKAVSSQDEEDYMGGMKEGRAGVQFRLMTVITLNVFSLGPCDQPLRLPMNA
jgi:hypothetical protein